MTIDPTLKGGLHSGGDPGSAVLRGRTSYTCGVDATDNRTCIGNAATAVATGGVDVVAKTERPAGRHRS